MRRGALFSLSSSARNQPYMCEHLRGTLYTLRASAVASGWACTGDCISRDLPFYSTARDRVEVEYQERAHSDAPAVVTSV